MGTNYYWHEKPECSCCNRPFDRVHIGKSSAGWVFSLHVYPEGHCYGSSYDGESEPPQYVDNLDDWIELFNREGSWIEDEYGDKVTIDEMLDCIRNREWPHDRKFPTSRYNSFEEFLRKNQAVEGPNNLLRHEIGDHCVGHGEGTWDYLVGYFC